MRLDYSSSRTLALYVFADMPLDELVFTPQDESNYSVQRSNLLKSENHPARGDPFEYGGAREDRTPDLLRARQALSQLSYGPDMVGLGRFELPTSPLSGVRSNQLSYRPVSSRFAVK